MIVGIGTDLVFIERIERLLARRGDRFLQRVYTPREIEACRSGPQRARRLAARFAAKEATLKALGTGLASGLSWRDIEVVGGHKEPPTIKLHGPAAALAHQRGIRRMHLSLSHDGPLAAAFVVLERG